MLHLIIACNLMGFIYSLAVGEIIQFEFVPNKFFRKKKKKMFCMNHAFSYLVTPPLHTSFACCSPIIVNMDQLSHLPQFNHLIQGWQQGGARLKDEIFALALHGFVLPILTLLRMIGKIFLPHPHPLGPRKTLFLVNLSYNYYNLF